MLQGPVKAYFDVASFDKTTLETQIEEDLQTMRQQYKQTAKFLTVAFQDLIQLTNAMQGMPSKQAALDQLQQLGITQNTKYVYDIIRQIHGSKGQEAQKLENLLKQVHYSQLINFDFKFSSKQHSISFSLIHADLFLYSCNCRQHDSIQRQVYYSAQDGASQPAQRERIGLH